MCSSEGCTLFIRHDTFCPLHKKHSLSQTSLSNGPTGFHNSSNSTGQQNSQQQLADRQTGGKQQDASKSNSGAAIFGLVTKGNNDWDAIFRLIMDEEAPLVSVDYRSPSGRGFVHVAAMQGDVVHLAKLHAFGADLDAADRRGRTAAHNAADSGAVAILLYLREKGYTLLKKDNEGMAPLALAEKWGRMEVVKLLHAFIRDDRRRAIEIKKANGLHDVKWTHENHHLFSMAIKHGVRALLLCGSRVNALNLAMDSILSYLRWDHFRWPRVALQR
jgi:hypothetical protein